ncbi:alpha/beta hydrolase [Epilithonimonas pallida]|uniref:Acetyl esterase/lipase n=1 Tax=Epilithonimonas pallida TaxID=373671 RepID=A0ABY1QXT7_9FLAO|nr:alpha/beta hydrolase [Epilithonimonas pallida]SMP86175.1 Acetyl esterase/lipase [Epilithonimonas pallida]
MKPAQVNLNQNSHLRKIFIRFSLVFISISKIYSQEIERPNAQPYTVEATFEKLKKKYSFIQPLNLEFPKNIKVKNDLKYKTRNGKSLLADIYFPENSSQKDPAIILVHGGGWISGSKENEKFLAQELASKGYIAMAINYSLSDFAKYPAAVEDIQDALKFLKKYHKKFGLNKKKIAIGGNSAGAQLATLVGVKNKVQAIVNIDGIVSFIHPESEEGTYAAYWFGATKAQNFELWKEASPLEYVGKNTPPTLFVNSSQPRFHAGRDDMIKKLKQYNIPTESHEIKESPHSFWLVQPWFGETLGYIVDFLDKVLKN